MKLVFLLMTLILISGCVNIYSSIDLTFNVVNNPILNNSLTTNISKADILKWVKWEIEYNDTDWSNENENFSWMVTNQTLKACYPAECTGRHPNVMDENETCYYTYAIACSVRKTGFNLSKEDVGKT